jgi:hypothetical protein
LTGLPKNRERLARPLGLAAALIAVSCGGGLSPTDVTAVKQGAQLNAMSYAELDASTPAAALERAAYCSEWGIANRNGFVVVDAGIGCSAP